MERERLRIGGLLVGFLALVVGALFVMDWFIIRLGGLGTAGVGLRKVEVCAPGMPCMSMSLSYVKGFFTTLATVAFWGTIGFGLIVVFQSGTRLLTGYANPVISRRAYLPGVMLILVAAAAGYVFGPEAQAGEIQMIKFEVERTFAPLLLILGLIAGIAALHVSTAVSDDLGEYKAVAPPAQASPVTAGREIAPAPTAAQTPAAPPGELELVPIIPVAQPAHLAGKLAYAVRSGELTKMGIDARREAGEPVLVLWRDLVGIIVRRLPAELDGATIIDLVSRPGSTLRLLPWSRLSGEVTMTSDDAGVRALVARLRELAPEARLDGATRTFIESSEAAAQFPDPAALATHDARVDQLGAVR